ncbi:hypothetical protein CVT24_001223, partial [Panaeolus cyanescens]
PPHLCGGSTCAGGGNLVPLRFLPRRSTGVPPSKGGNRKFHSHPVELPDWLGLQCQADVVTGDNMRSIRLCSGPVREKQSTALSTMHFAESDASTNMDLDEPAAV